MLKIMAGTTSRNSSTPRALPNPLSWPPPKETLYICTATTVAALCEESGARMYTRSKILRTLMIRVTSTTISTGRTSGTVTLRNTCHSVAPSTRAASRDSRGRAARPAEISTIAKPAQIHRYDTMIEGVINDGPSQDTPANASAKSDLGNRRVYPSPDRPANRNVPSAAVFVVATTLPSLTASTVIRGRPFSVASPPPALVKSSHTTPARPLPAGGVAAGFASPGTLSALSPTTGSSAAVPAPAGWTVWYGPPSGPSSTLLSRGRTPAYGVGGEKVSCTPTMIALSTPRSGFWSYTSRQVTPADRNEIAIGMNSMVLNAVDSLIRSVSTAKTRPRMVTTVGVTTTQTTLLVIARRVSGALNMVT